MVSGDKTHVCGLQCCLHCCFGNCEKDVKNLDRVQVGLKVFWSIGEIRPISQS